jgi:hypothetical protein
MQETRPMRTKLTLKVEELAVVTFETERADAARGTVAAHEVSGNGFTCKTCLTHLTCCTPRY